MATTYSIRELYGGAIAVELPTEFIDSSDIRQIPDHQEVFLSPTTLTSIIFELNDYVQPQPLPAATQQPQQNGTSSTSPQTDVDADAEAAKYHFNDVISPPDSLASPLPASERTAMHAASLSGFPTLVLAGTIHSVDKSRSSRPSATASSSSSSLQQQQSIVHQLQLLIRMKNYATDLCVRVNVPMKELAQRGGGEVAAEVAHAKELLDRVVASLDVRDFGLFGAAA
ncbi:hypothetical protein LTR99_005951 [Exophiala xenobiotica]|uniref:Mog1p/PsbP-like protein n=1 Tax=Vermiconidia calcicola TaxID=1690605 RepID=A0AAV9QEJ6_9PEZI|nr:hypothetical protein LTR96_007756 [Exophiala xenobiotica]KAK5540976.1 hypothetical protein LTR25_002753 [Vermiconidia calcicola]KAK5549532.1 hypothetical protein LTR23_000640 [Chaetothyriales sp. CCFEE 6169]KAK5302994.1 hypothetical protein LTR99_005951 [Exophiala xenobiotica]KAK5340690.1 hypothetical protein LTR98_003812 [Exophiala xenobiotica]